MPFRLFHLNRPNWHRSPPLSGDWTQVVFTCSPLAGLNVQSVGRWHPVEANNNLWTAASAENTTLSVEWSEQLFSALANNFWSTVCTCHCWWTQPCVHLFKAGWLLRSILDHTRWRLTKSECSCHLPCHLYSSSKVWRMPFISWASWLQNRLTDLAGIGSQAFKVRLLFGSRRNKVGFDGCCW